MSVNDENIHPQSRLALMDSEERLRLIEENVRDYAIFTLDTDGRIASWNQGAERILCYSEAEIIGQPFAIIFTPEDREADAPETEMNTAKARGRSEDERWHQRKDSLRFWASGILTALRDAEGALCGYAKILRDVTERKRIEQQRQEALALLDTLFDTAPIGFAFFDCNLCYVRINRAMAKINGMSAEEHVGRRVQEILSDQAAEITQDLQQVLATGSPVLEREMVIKTPLPPEQQRTWLTSYYPVRTQGQQMLGVGAAAVEITEHKRAEAEIWELNAKLQRSMTETHHRVKNNLQLMAALIDIQKGTDRETVPMDELVRLGQNIKVLGVIHDILTQEAKETGDVATLSVKAVLEQLLPMLQSTMGRRSLSFRIEEIHLPGRKATSIALLTNELVSNAVKHGTGVVEISLEIAPDTATLAVCDDGPGFPLGFDARMASNTGLELVESIATYDLMGQTSYQNRPEGGARVTVAFPLNQL